VKDFGAKMETLMQLRLSPDEEQKELDSLQLEFRRFEEVTSKHYDPVVVTTQRELSDLGSELFEILSGMQ
jgi:hypothetical protein